VRLSAVIQPPASISYFLFPATQLQLDMPDAMPMPFSCTCHWAQLPTANANANGMCSWGWTKSNAHGPRLKAGGLVGLRDTILYKRLEVFLVALGGFVTHVRRLWSRNRIPFKFKCLVIIDMDLRPAS
jgi:hypothetical protein